MWQVDNRTPFAADRGWLRDRDGAEVWIVVVKATFGITARGDTFVAADQPPPVRVPQYHGEPGKSSLRYDNDFVLTKRSSDITMLGHACAPAGRRVPHLDVGLRIGELAKRLRVFGDRRWGKGAISRPELFERMPIVYERAFGGTDTRTPEGAGVVAADARNPVGVGFAPDAERDALPNVEDPRHLITARSDRPAPAGFGPLASHWQPRAGFAGTYDEHWQMTRQPLLAEDLDDRFFQSAPPDQQSTHFVHGGEPVTLDNVHASAARLSFVLPRLYLGFDTRFLGGGRAIHKNRHLHSVIFEPDHPRVSMVWHSALRCHWKVQKLERTIITLKQPQAMSPQAEAPEAEVEWV